MKLPDINSNLYRGEVEVTENRQISPRYWMLSGDFPVDSFSVEPGQFAHIRVSPDTDPLLRRPFSYHNVETAGEDRIRVHFLYAVVGKGTRVMRDLSPGDTFWKMGPMGNQFSLPDEDCTPVLLGGGVGVPPIHMFARKLDREWTGNREVHVLIGARSEDEILRESDFRSLDITFHVATEDGSRGHTGYVTDLFEHLVAKNAFPSPLQLYGCGPHGMLDAIRALAEKRSLPAEIAIERQMGCALGICRACVVKVKSPETGSEAQVATVCREGPVFDAHHLVPDWNDA